MCCLGSARDDRKNSEGGPKRKRDDRGQGRAAVSSFFSSETLASASKLAPQLESSLAPRQEAPTLGRGMSETRGCRELCVSGVALCSRRSRVQE